MAQKIKFGIIQSLFRLFSFLADKTDGWRMFAQPKLWLGAIIIGSIASCGSSQKPTCYEVTPNDTISNEEMPEVRITPTCYEPAVPDCYKPVKSVPSDTVVTEVIEVTTCYLPIYEPTEEDTIKLAPTDEKIPIEIINSVQPPTCYISLPPKSTNKLND